LNYAARFPLATDYQEFNVAQRRVVATADLHEEGVEVNVENPDRH
jgi:hypothetical protein